MGSIFSRNNRGVEEVEISGSNAYRYPPKTGCYFGSHFYMGGEKFETTQPESYLFGENTDLNFLGNRPAPWPYPPPQAHEPTKTLKSLINIRRDSIRLVKIKDQENENGDVDEESGERQQNGEENDSHRYRIEFTFDADVRVAITIHYFATEEISNGQAVYTPRDPQMSSETYHYKRGANQNFNQSQHVVQPDKYNEEDWLYNPDKDVIPIVIQCVVEDEQHSGHSHASFAVIERSVDGNYVLKALKQKQMVDGLYFLLQEIYGIENKSPERQKLDEDLDDNGCECVICMCEARDTLILPCRHLCLCNLCADNLRYQANNCPICRAPFRALLQLRAITKKQHTPPLPPLPQVDDDSAVSQDGVPAGYEAVSLIEALNGPQSQSHSNPLTQPLSHSISPQLPPDDNTGNSPVLKRKQKRSSGRSGRHPKRHVVQEEVKSQPVSNAPTPTEGAVAMDATKKQPGTRPAGGQTADGQTAAPPIADTEKHREKGEHEEPSEEKVTPQKEVSDTDNDGAKEIATNEKAPANEEDESTQFTDTAENNNNMEQNESETEHHELTEAPHMEENLDDADIEEATPLCLDLERCTAGLEVKGLGVVELRGEGDSSASSYSSTASDKGLLESETAEEVKKNPTTQLCETDI